jgi:WD40 repeat protein
LIFSRREHTFVVLKGATVRGLSEIVRAMAEFKEFQVQSEYLYEQEVLNAHKKSITYLKYKNWEATDGIPEEKKAVLITGSEDQTVRIWNMNTKKSLKCFLGFFSQSIDSLDFHPFQSFHYLLCIRKSDLFAKQPIGECHRKKSLCSLPIL